MNDWCLTCIDTKVEAYKNRQTGEIKFIRACQFIKLEDLSSEDWERHQELDGDCFETWQ